MYIFFKFMLGGVLKVLFGPACPSTSYMDLEGRGVRSPDPAGKSQVDIGFLRNTGTNPLRGAIGPRVQLL